MVVLKNVTAAIALKSQAVLPDKTRDNPALGAPISIIGYLESMPQEEVFGQYAVWLKSTAIFQCDVPDFMSAAASLGFLSAAFALTVGDTGNPVLESLSVSTGVLLGVWVFTMTDATHFGVADPNHAPHPVGQFGVLYTAVPGLSLFIQPGSVPCVLGDSFTVTVTPNGAGFAAAAADAELKITASQSGQGANVGRIYHVRGRPNVFDDGLPCDHAAFLLDQEQYPLQS